VLTRGRAGCGEAAGVGLLCAAGQGAGGQEERQAQTRRNGKTQRAGPSGLAPRVSPHDLSSAGSARRCVRHAAAPSARAALRTDAYLARLRPPALLQTTTPHLQDAAAQGLASTALRRRIELASRSQAPSASSARLPVSSVRGPWPAWRVPAFCSSTTTAHHRRRRRTSWACTRACVRQATRCASSCPAVVRTALARRKAREASSRSRSPPEKSWGGMAGSLAPIGVW
jgi:hypothetical protein